MTWFLRSVLREAWASLRAQWLSSAAGAGVVAGMCAAVLLTQGSVAATRAEIVGSLAAESARSIVVRADANSGVRSDVLERLGTIENIEAAYALGPASDVWNAALPGGGVVGLREVSGLDVDTDGLSALPGSVYVSRAAAAELGLSAGIGAVAGTGVTRAVAGIVALPEALEFLEPIALLPATEPGIRVAVLVVVCDDVASVTAVTAALVGMLGATGPSTYSVETSGALHDFAQAIAVETSAGFQAITFGVLAVMAALVALLLTALVTIRRRDFGRRRALGASRSYIAALVLAHAVMLSAVGVLAGTGAAYVATLALGRPAVPASYAVSVAVLACAAAVTFSIIPALLAARRDPVRVLRTP